MRSHMASTASDMATSTNWPSPVTRSDISLAKSFTIEASVSVRAPSSIFSHTA